MNDFRKDRPYWCEICAKKKECYGITLKPNCFVPTEEPTTEQSSTVEIENKCDTCCQYKIGFEDGKLEMIRMIEDSLKGKSE